MGLAIPLWGFAIALLIADPPHMLGTALQFPNGDARALGQIEKLVVTVFCGHITSLHDIPQAHDVRMSYETQAGDIMEAHARLGISAVPLQQWNNVIRVVSESDSCFAVNVTARGRNEVSRDWTGQQLGLTN
jgi:hypothetical protein